MNYDGRNMPKCFTHVVDWREWNRLSTVSDHRGTYCSDCTPSFKQQMIEENRCRFKGTTFTTIHSRDGRTEHIGSRAS